MSDTPRTSSRSSLRHVLVLVGPTASGKTSISLLLARALDGEIVSADSRQVYRRLDIGTAKPPVADRAGVPHHLLDIIEPDGAFNAGEFGRRGREAIASIFDRGKTPIVAGGSGLYVQALIDGFFDGPAAEPELRASLYRRAHTEGSEALLRELSRVDPESAAHMLPSNIRRIVRALEVFTLTGVPISALKKSETPADFAPVMFGLQWDRATLYRRIDSRVDDMLARGFVDEVIRLREIGYSPALNALQTVGYKEAFDFIEGRTSRESMMELMKRNSRRYAKRQLTWFRRDKRIRWVELSDELDFAPVAEKIAREYRAESSPRR